MRRRDFIGALGGAVVLPLAARAQQQVPVIGFLQAGSASSTRNNAAAFRQGLSEGGFVEGRNVKIEYRWADGIFDRVPGLAADLVQRQVALITTGGTTVALAAKAATSTIPILFVSGLDAIHAGLVSSFNRPEANLTGVNLFSNVVTAKRLQLLHQITGAGASIAMLTNPKIAKENDREIQDIEQAAGQLGRKVAILYASDDREIDIAFATMVAQRIGGLIVQTEPFLTSRSDQLILLTTRYAIPTISGWPQFPRAGGLMSYGTDLAAANRQLGLYAAHLLKGAKPADLPVLQPTKFELIINLKSAKALGLDIPSTLLATADEVIE